MGIQGGLYRSRSNRRCSSTRNGTLPSETRSPSLTIDTSVVTSNSAAAWAAFCGLTTMGAMEFERRNGRCSVGGATPSTSSIGVSYSSGEDAWVWRKDWTFAAVVSASMGNGRPHSCKVRPSVC